MELKGAGNEAGTVCKRQEARGLLHTVLFIRSWGGRRSGRFRFSQYHDPTHTLAPENFLNIGFKNQNHSHLSEELKHQTNHKRTTRLPTTSLVGHPSGTGTGGPSLSGTVYEHVLKHYWYGIGR